MTPEQFRADWITALRSGKYQQTKHVLQDNEGYCCLGVACALYDCHVESLESRKAVYSFQGITKNCYAIDGEKEFPSLKVVDAIGLTHDNLTTLAIMNDAGKSFEEIADRLESMSKRQSP